MKKLAGIIITLCIAISAHSYAEGKKAAVFELPFGIHSSLVYSSFNKEYPNNRKTAYSFGIYREIKLKNTPLFIRPELEYIIKGNSYSTNDHKLSATSNVNNTLRYIQLPLYFGAHTLDVGCGRLPNTLRIMAGPYISYLLSNQYNISSTSENGNTSVIEGSYKGLNKVDYGYSLAAILRVMRISPAVMHIGITYNRGLADIAPSQNSLRTKSTIIPGDEKSALRNQSLKLSLYFSLNGHYANKYYRNKFKRKQ